MKDKNLPDDNNSKSLEELTEEASSIIEELEKQTDLKNSLEDYQKLIKLNNIIENLENKKDLGSSISDYQMLIKLNNLIEKKFQNNSKKISQITKEKISKILDKKNEKKVK